MKKLMLSAGLALAAGPALAHPGHGFGFEAGLLHPLTGADHLLAMLAVGLWSGFALKRHVWAGAASFMAAMTLGAGLAWAGLRLPGVEGAILASLLGFGLMVALARRGQGARVTGASLAMVALFAAAHGYAHGAEAKGAVSLYLAGFLIATAALHLVGIYLARQVARVPLAQGLIGAGIAGAGLLMMVG